MQPVGWRALWLIASAWLVTGDPGGQQYDYLEMYTSEDQDDQDAGLGERYYQDDEDGTVLTAPIPVTEEMGFTRVRRYEKKEMDHQQMNDIQNVLKDILEAQGIDKFFESSSLVATLTQRAKALEPTVTQARVTGMLTAFMNAYEPSRSSRWTSRPPPTHSSSRSDFTNDDAGMPSYSSSATASESETGEDGDYAIRLGLRGSDDNTTHTESTSTTQEQTSTTEEQTSTTEEQTTTLTTTSTTSRCVTRLRKTTTTTVPTPALDIDALLAIMANLTYDYDTQFVQMLNESLMQFSIPTCPTPTTTTEVTTTIPDYSLYNATVMAKCFVCGLEAHGVPVNAYCADAFAGDFIPLVPVDPKAKGQISRYRKYCRYRDVHNYALNESLPRSIFGRWTGGCSVRWIDLSGIYTQRSCRNRHRAVLGRHYGSKRMAKLEMALQHVDNGCIISPMATLVPLSRGISLYARFHACVCTGSWCNVALRKRPCTVNTVTLLFLLLRQFVT